MITKQAKKMNIIVQCSICKGIICLLIMASSVQNSSLSTNLNKIAKLKFNRRFKESIISCAHYSSEYEHKEGGLQAQDKLISLCNMFSGQRKVMKESNHCMCLSKPLIISKQGNEINCLDVTIFWTT